jgi:hypothetical protein
MTVNLESFRYPFETEIANESDGAKAAHRNAYQGILDLNQAVASLKSQLTSATTTTTTSSTSTSTSTGTQTVVTNTATTTIGYVNDQTGVTAYTTLQSDYAKFIILDDASPIAITLSVASSSPAITLPWYVSFLNFGAGTATLTPIDGTISYRENLAAASMPVAQNCAATVVYDGTNFWADLVPIATLTQFGLVKPDGTTIKISSGVISVPTATYTTLGIIEAVAPIAHEWINSINLSGVPQLSQPAFTDISGVASFSQIPLYPYVAKTANYTLTTTDYQVECTANSFTITLPTAVGVTGQIYSIKNSGTGTITVATTSSQTIDGNSTQPLIQWENLVVMSNGANWIIL